MKINNIKLNSTLRLKNVNNNINVNQKQTDVKNIQNHTSYPSKTAFYGINIPNINFQGKKHKLLTESKNIQNEARDLAQKAKEIQEESCKIFDEAYNDYLDCFFSGRNEIIKPDGKRVKFISLKKQGSVFVGFELETYDENNKLVQKVYFKNNLPYKIRQFPYERMENRYHYDEKGNLCSYAKNKRTTAQDDSSSEEIFYFIDNELDKIIKNFRTYKDEKKRTIVKSEDIFIFDEDNLKTHIKNKNKISQKLQGSTTTFEKIFKYDDESKLEKIYLNSTLFEKGDKTSASFKVRFLVDENGIMTEDNSN